MGKNTLKKGDSLFDKAEKLLDDLGENDIGNFKSEFEEIKNKIKLIIESQIKIMEKLSEISLMINENMEK